MKKLTIFLILMVMLVAIIYYLVKCSGDKPKDIIPPDKIGEQIILVDRATKDSLRLSEGHVKTLKDSLQLLKQLLKVQANKTSDAKARLDKSIVAVAIDTAKSDDCAELLENCTDYALQVEQEKQLQEKRIAEQEELIKEQDEQITILSNSNDKLKKIGYTAVELFGATYNAYQKAKKPKRIGIGVQTGWGLNNKPYIGLGISYNLIRF